MEKDGTSSSTELRTVSRELLVMSCISEKLEDCGHLACYMTSRVGYREGGRDGYRVGYQDDGRDD